VSWPFQSDSQAGAGQDFRKARRRSSDARIGSGGVHRGRSVSTGIVVGGRVSGPRSSLAMTCARSRVHREPQPDTSIATADRHLRWEAEASDYFARRDPERLTRRLVARLQSLGHNVILEPLPRPPDPSVHPDPDDQAFVLTPRQFPKRLGRAYIRG
jgi:hypothetical protein